MEKMTLRVMNMMKSLIYMSMIAFGHFQKVMQVMILSIVILRLKSMKVMKLIDISRTLEGI